MILELFEFEEHDKLYVVNIVKVSFICFELLNFLNI